jgi:hypothetical protein
VRGKGAKAAEVGGDGWLLRNVVVIVSAVSELGLKMEIDG